MREYGGEVIFCQPTLEARDSTCQEVQARTGATLIPPFNYGPTIAGQGTIALELLQQAGRRWGGGGGGRPGAGGHRCRAGHHRAGGAAAGGEAAWRGGAPSWGRDLPRWEGGHHDGFPGAAAQHLRFPTPAPPHHPATPPPHHHAQVPDLDAIVVPVSGGGMIAGIAIAAKALRPTIKVGGWVGCQATTVLGSAHTGRPPPPDTWGSCSAAAAICLKQTWCMCHAWHQQGAGWLRCGCR